ncbi:MAG: hypothetical protein MUF75_01420 [Bacteroidia bacterium]|jgi:hypothetical protein|nr:hypothetical protein [Bacteroidia bacterium]
MKCKQGVFIMSMVFLAAFSGCKKDDTIFNGYFYSSQPGSEGQLWLYLDGSNKGALPFINTKQIGFTGDSIKKYALPLPIKAGKYKLEVKDQSGTIRAQGKFKVTTNKVSSSGGIGGQEVVMENGEVRIGVSY